MRVPWTPHFPPVLVHTHYEADDHADGLPGISDNGSWHAAKRTRDARAAVSLIDSVCNDEVLDLLCDTVVPAMSGRSPLVLAPAATPSESANALAITYANFIADEFGWGVEERIFQKKDFKKDAADFWERIVHSSGFYGPVEAGRLYVLVDDVFTIGGTLADLRGYIVSNGGLVVAMSALAHRSGKHVQIALAERTRFGLIKAYNGRLDVLLGKELGYGQDCLTEIEGSRLLRSGSLDAIRNGINGARDS